MSQRICGDAGAEIIIEEYLEGQEISLLTISDGYTGLNFPLAMDHKRAFDNDEVIFLLD